MPVPAQTTDGTTPFTVISSLDHDCRFISPRKFIHAQIQTVSSFVFLSKPHSKAGCHGFPHLPRTDSEHRSSPYLLSLFSRIKLKTSGQLNEDFCPREQD